MSLRPRPVDFDQIWTPLKNSLLRIMKLECITRTDWDNHFHDVYALCVACPKDHSQQLYDEIKKTLEAHNRVATHNDERLLEAYKDSWLIYNKGAEYVDKLFGYLNNQFIRKQKYTEADINFGGISAEQIRSSMLEIGELALEIWRRLMIAPLEEKLVKLLLDGIKKDRDGLNVQNNVIKSVLTSFVEVEKRLKENMELYQKLFEEKFLEKTSEHYSREAASLLESLTCSEYMQRVLSRIREEDLRSRRFLDPSSYDKVIKVCQTVMVESHIDFLSTVVHSMIRNEQLQDLSNLYTLVKPLSKTQGLDILVREFENHVKTIAIECVINLSNDPVQVPQQFIEGILSIHKRFSGMVHSVFQNDQDFVAALDRLAKYTDHLLRKSSKGLSDTEIEEKGHLFVEIFFFNSQQKS
uniref:Cullin N-terminal domain-containing protein n=1 Tax=Romanomermis culicivorax TaxID=13658 RepID=A0A915JAA7_ROMCU